MAASASSAVALSLIDPEDEALPEDELPEDEALPEDELLEDDPLEPDEPELDVVEAVEAAVDELDSPLLSVVV